MAHYNSHGTVEGRECHISVEPALSSSIWFRRLTYANLLTSIRLLTRSESLSSLKLMSAASLDGIAEFESLGLLIVAVVLVGVWADVWPPDLLLAVRASRLDRFSSWSKLVCDFFSGSRGSISSMSSIKKSSTVYFVGYCVQTIHLAIMESVMVLKSMRR